MGLDGVEIVMEVEDEFEITISDDEAQSMRRVIDVIECVCGKLKLKRERLTVETCPTAAAFYRLRRVLVEAVNVDRTLVRPRSQIADLIGRDDRRRVWHVLQDAGYRPPRLLPRESVVIAATVITLLLTVVLVWITWLIAPHLWTLLSALPYALLLVTCAYWLIRPWEVEVARPCTVGEIATRATTWPAKAAVMSDAEFRRWVSERVRSIIAEQMGYPVDRVTENARFVEDLHVD